MGGEAADALLCGFANLAVGRNPGGAFEAGRKRADGWPLICEERLLQADVQDFSPGDDEASRLDVSG